MILVHATASKPMLFHVTSLISQAFAEKEAASPNM